MQPSAFSEIELEEIGVFPINQARLDHFFPRAFFAEVELSAIDKV